MKKLKYPRFEKLITESVRLEEAASMNILASHERISRTRKLLEDGRPKRKNDDGIAVAESCRREAQLMPHDRVPPQDPEIIEELDKAIEEFRRLKQGPASRTKEGELRKEDSSKGESRPVD